MRFIIRHGGEEGVTCNVIAFDSKSDQGKLDLLDPLSKIELLLAGWATGIVGSTLAAARRVKKWISQQVLTNQKPVFTSQDCNDQS